MSQYCRASQRKDDDEQFKDYPMKYFVVAMDNYFALPSVISALRELGIGVVGTSRMRKNWPPTELRGVNQESVDFNSFHYLILAN